MKLNMPTETEYTSIYIKYSKTSTSIINNELTNDEVNKLKYFKKWIIMYHVTMNLNFWKYLYLE